MLSLSSDALALVTIGAALVQTILLAVAGLVAWSQLREAAKTRRLEAVIRMFEDFGSREAYHYADTLLGLPKRVQDYSHDEFELAIWCVRVYEKLGFLVDSDLIPEEYLVPLYSRRIVWSWDALRPFIEEQRRLRATGGAYRLAGDGKYFEKLHERALIYRRAHERKDQVDPPIPDEYRERLLAAIRRGDRLIPQPDLG